METPRELDDENTALFRTLLMTLCAIYRSGNEEILNTVECGDHAREFWEMHKDMVKEAVPLLDANASQVRDSEPYRLCIKCFGGLADPFYKKPWAALRNLIEGEET